MPWRLLGNSTNKMLHAMPIPIGTRIRSSLASSEGVGKKQFTTFLSNKAIVAKTNMEANAWKRSINLSWYWAFSSGASFSDVSITHKPLNVASPYLTLPLSSLKLSVKRRMKHDTPQRAKRPRVMTRLACVGQRPWWVKIGERIWNVRTEPVGRSLAKCAVPLNVFLIVFCAGVFCAFGAFSKRGSCCCCRRFVLTSITLILFLSLGDCEGATFMQERNWKLLAKNLNNWGVFNLIY